MALRVHPEIATARDTVHEPVPYVKNGDLRAAARLLETLGVEHEEPDAEDDLPLWGWSETNDGKVQLTLSEEPAGEVPDVIGMGARDAVFQMEKAGLHATLQGTGSVVRQSLPAGTPAVRGKTVRLELSTDVHRKKTHPRRVTHEKADSLATRGAGPHMSADTTKKNTAS